MNLREFLKEGGAKKGLKFSFKEIRIWWNPLEGKPDKKD